MVVEYAIGTIQNLFHYWYRLFFTIPDYGIKQSSNFWLHISFNHFFNQSVNYGTTYLLFVYLPRTSKKNSTKSISPTDQYPRSNFIFLYSSGIYANALTIKQ